MSYDKRYKDFYRNPTVEKLQELITSGNLTNSNVYTLLDGYSGYRKEQIQFDSPN